MNKKRHESFVKFFENPSREALRELLQHNTGEEDYLDFKKEWPEIPKLSKHILAFSNSGGGAIIVGVEESGNELNSIGINKLLDKSEIDKGVRNFIGPEILYEIIDFPFSESEYPTLKGKVFQVLIVEYDENRLPWISRNNGKDIKSKTIYVRSGTNSQEASHEDVQRLINLRIETQFSTKPGIELGEHLSQLKILYGQIEEKIKKRSQSPIAFDFSRLAKQLYGNFELVDNPNYPKENYEEFISRMIDAKKKVIEKEIM
ncbi:AlbA family DNA-binding domain-containing protein [Paenibacillus sp. FSL R7-0179]|uniref:AlbA family DNA-binding domain-containing protein n=1 Tax=Paenibacillus sp. FSL R7-0179 TaxID=2921672 RepID=UPI0030FA9C62